MYHDEVSGPIIALTRDREANVHTESLIRSLARKEDLKVQCVHIPCIEFSEIFENTTAMRDILTKNDSFDAVVITSPRAAKLFADQYLAVISASVGSLTKYLRIASVGRGTSNTLLNFINGSKLSSNVNITVFEPAHSTADSLGADLPISFGQRLLYPTSSLSDGQLESVLRGRGFQVQRMNVYSTTPSPWTADQIEIATHVDIISMASPSAINVWKSNFRQIQPENGSNSLPQPKKAVVIVIGPKSEMAARKAGFENIVAPKAHSRRNASYVDISTSEMTSDPSTVDCWAETIIDYVRSWNYMHMNSTAL